MTKVALVAAFAAIVGLSYLAPADCHTDNGKWIDGCTVVDGKPVFKD